jgi:hypothetical protein
MLCTRPGSVLSCTTQVPDIYDSSFRDPRLNETCLSVTETRLRRAMHDTLCVLTLVVFILLICENPKLSHGTVGEFERCTFLERQRSQCYGIMTSQLSMLRWIDDLA